MNILTKTRVRVDRYARDVAYLYHSDDLTGGIFDRHAEHGGVFETGVLVHRLIETGVVVGVGNIDSLKYVNDQRYL